jgi:hypothetical protein
LQAQGFIQSKQELPNGVDRCAYRGADGMKCAIGHLIDDEDYVPGFEGKGILSVARAYGPTIFRLIARKFVGFTDYMFLTALQGIHDRTSEPEEMKNRLQIFAKNSGLTVPED